MSVVTETIHDGRAPGTPPSRAARTASPPPPTDTAKGANA